MKKLKTSKQQRYFLNLHNGFVVLVRKGRRMGTGYSPYTAGRGCNWSLEELIQGDIVRFKPLTKTQAVKKCPALPV